MKLTDEQVELFKTLYDEGKNDTEIAFALDVSIRSVRVKRQELGWPQNGAKPRKRFTQDEIDKIIELSKVYTMSEIARIIGATEPGVRGVLYRNNKQAVSVRETAFVGEPCRDFTSTTNMLIVQCITEGYKLSFIAKLLHRDKAMLLEYCRTHMPQLLRAHRLMMEYGGLYANRKGGIHDEREVQRLLECAVK